MREGLDNLSAEVEDELRGKWQDSPLLVVPGHEVLMELFRKYGLHFRKERDAAGLARALKPEEIDKELLRLVEDACAV